jgi:hypothetical protein
MKGMFFTTFMELVEEEYGLKTAELVALRGKSLSKGLYATAGNYDFHELARMMKALCESQNLAEREFLNTYAHKLMNMFVMKYIGFFAGKKLFTFLNSLEEQVHGEVRHSYPESELPRFIVHQEGDRELVMEYRSEKPFADLAECLLIAAIEHFKEKVEMDIVTNLERPLNCRTFKLKKIAA